MQRSGSGRPRRAARPPAGRSLPSGSRTTTATRWSSRSAAWSTTAAGERGTTPRFRQGRTALQVSSLRETSMSMTCTRESRRPVRAEARVLQVGEEGARSRGRHRRPGHAHADRAVLREPAADRPRPVRPVGPRGDRHLRVLRRAPGVVAGRADRDPRNERARRASAMPSPTAASGCRTRRSAGCSPPRLRAHLS